MQPLASCEELFLLSKLKSHVFVSFVIVPLIVNFNSRLIQEHYFGYYSITQRKNTNITVEMVVICYLLFALTVFLNHILRSCVFFAVLSEVKVQKRCVDV